MTHQLASSVLGAEISFVAVCAIAVYLALWPAAWAWQSLRGNGPPVGFLRLGLAALPVAGALVVLSHFTAEWYHRLYSYAALHGDARSAQQALNDAWLAAVVVLFTHSLITRAFRRLLTRPAPSAIAPAGAPLTPPPQRGTWLADEAGVTRNIRETFAELNLDPATLVPLGNLFLTPEAEVLHTKVVGTTGSGKSTALRHMVAAIDRRGAERAIIADPDGGYLSRFYDPARGDIVLNPFDARSAGWNLFADIRTEYDADQIAASLVPERQGEGAEWAQYAQQLVSATITALQRSMEGPSTADLYRAVAKMPVKDYAALLADSHATPFFDKGNERMLGSIRSTAVGALKGLSYIEGGPEAFSLTDYITQGKGWLFLTYQAAQIAALKALIATWLRILIFATMSLPEGDAGLWFVVDELDALGKIGGLTDALARLRKFGGRCVLAFQSIGALNALYGPEFAGVLVENCTNTLILRCAPTGGAHGAGGTSAYASALLGKREVLKTQWQSGTTSGETSGNSSGWGGSGSHGGISDSSSSSFSSSQTTNYVVEDTMLPSEIESLPTLSGVVHVDGIKLWSRCTIPPFDGRPRASAFVPKLPARAGASALPAPEASGGENPMENAL